jgi:class 3 adenylate cyclase
MNEDNLSSRLTLMRRDCPLPGEVVDAFERWVRTAPDDELFRVDVISWAESRGLDEDVGLDIFLHATAAGIFELSWGVLCPACGMMIQTPGGLRALGPEPHCRLCQISFPAAADDQIEVSFSLEPSIRKLRFYEPGGVDVMSDGPRLFFGSTREPVGAHAALGRMMRAAGGVDPGQEIALDVTLDSGMGAVLVPAVHAIAFARLEPGQPTEARFEIHDGAMLPGQVALAPGPLRISAVNRTHHSLTLCVAQLPTDTPGLDRAPTFRIRPFLTGKRVLTSQTFRDLFRTETIGASGLRIKNLTILFSDLTGSTQLYERVGDLRALDLVREHFDKLTEVVRVHRGAVVKTIGDAVMAAFVDPEPAVAAAASMNEALRTIEACGDPLAIKAGIHLGACIAIESNHQIDYFGTAVNAAARIQGVASQGGEIVVSDNVWQAPGVQARVERLGLRATADHVHLRGIEIPVPIYRLNQN